LEGREGRVKLQGTQRRVECTPEVEETPQVPAPSVLESPIWNPIATVNWSLLFTPVFGAYLQMLNWKSLGQEDSARESKYLLPFCLSSEADTVMCHSFEQRLGFRSLGCMREG
jgi:hypothetical protein